MDKYQTCLRLLTGRYMFPIVRSVQRCKNVGESYKEFTWIIHQQFRFGTVAGTVITKIQFLVNCACLLLLRRGLFDAY